MGKRGRPPKYKVKFVNGSKKVEEAVNVKRKEVVVENKDVDKGFETTNREQAFLLVEKGFCVLETRSPTADRKEKLYIFKETEKQVKEALNNG